MQIEKLDHLVLTVRNIEATCAFYTKIFGMRMVFFDDDRRALGIVDVVEDELCIREVAKIPMNKPTIGLDVELISVSANPFPNNFKDDPIRSILNRNR